MKYKLFCFKYKIWYICLKYDIFLLQTEDFRTFYLNKNYFIFNNNNGNYF